MDLLTLTNSGLYCSKGNFYIDPWRPVNKALITHGHSDHARYGSKAYLCLPSTAKILKLRLGEDVSVETINYGESLDINGVNISFHPAGHILGSAQIRVEYKGEIWVVSGDYKLNEDPTCEAFEPVKCNVFISESTFGLPVYKWPASSQITTLINEWWQKNQKENKTTILFAYALGKAQRLLAGLDPSIGPIYTHGAVENINAIYRQCKVNLPPTKHALNANEPEDWSKAIVLAPPSALQSSWMKRFGKTSKGFASGWMSIRGNRRRRSMDRGFVMSDHADWHGLLEAIKSSQADRVLLTHGYTQPMVRWLNENGLQADELATKFTGEQDGELEV